MAGAAGLLQGPTGDPIVDEAIRRFRRCREWESVSRQRFLDDLKFAYGDSENGYQWPGKVRQQRDVELRPCLTMNVTRQHNFQITNEAKKNKSDIAIKAVGGGASKASANVFAGVVRHISYKSNALDAYSTASEFQVAGGIGWLRLVTDYAGDDSFEQDIYIRAVADPMSVYVDPDAREKNKCDAKFAFVFDDVPKDEFEDAYPDLASYASAGPLGMDTVERDWMGDNYIRVAEYFRIVPQSTRLFSVSHKGKRTTIREDRLPKNAIDEIVNDELTRIRHVDIPRVEWFLIVGQQIVDRTIWLGSNIPLIPMIGEEVIIEGIMDRKGHTRAMKDAQRMFNYNASSQVEFVALQSKSPYVAPAAAIENFEQYYNSANTANHSVLPYNHRDDDGQEIPAPQRQAPPAVSQAFQLGMDTAFNQMMMTSGQWQNQMGMMGNERTGSAIEQRQEQSATSTYHFVDNYGIAIRTCGQFLIELIPLVYNEPRVVKMLADDGADHDVEIDPAAQQAYLETQAADGAAVRRIFNPSVGKYEVEAAVGPAFGTRREETVRALTLILTQAPALTGIIGDLLLKAMDFKEADEAAQRLRRMVPPQALGEGPTQQEQALQGQVNALQGALIKALEKHGKDALKLVGKDQMRDIDAYDAETRRLAAMKDMIAGADPEGTKRVVEQLIDEVMKTRISEIPDANAQGVQNQSGGADLPPVPGAKRAPDGQWYLTDPTREGRYLRVAPLAQEHATRNIIANG